MIQKIFIIVYCLLFLFSANTLKAQESSRLLQQIQTSYQEIYDALKSRNFAKASNRLTKDYAEYQLKGEILTRTDRDFRWQDWLKDQNSIERVFINIENLKYDNNISVSATTRIVLVLSVKDKEGKVNQEVVDELRSDIWIRSRGDWNLQSSKVLAPPVSGEIIPGADQPESRRLHSLLEEIQAGNKNALTKFWQDVEAQSPIVESVPNDPRNKLVTFVWRHSPEIQNVGLFGNLPYPPSGDRSLVRLPGTDIWYRSLLMPVNSRTTYGFDIFRNFSAGVKSNHSTTFILSVPDPRNPRTFFNDSVVETADQLLHSYATERQNLSKGKLIRETIHSNSLNEDRIVTVYTPPDFMPKDQKYPVVILFDGAVYGGGQQSKVPTPTILDNLIADKKIPPVICLLIHNKDRISELNGSINFTSFLVDEIIPMVRLKFHGTNNPKQVVIGGSSLGGMAALYAALEHPDLFGNVLSQSGAFWMPRDSLDPAVNEAIPPQPWLIDEFINSPPADLRIWMEVSQFESPAKMIGPNRQLRDVLRAKGYLVAYRELYYGHDYLHWRESLAEGLIYLLGTPDKKS